MLSGYLNLPMIYSRKKQLVVLHSVAPVLFNVVFFAVICLKFHFINKK